MGNFLRLPLNGFRGVEPLVEPLALPSSHLGIAKAGFASPLGLSSVPDRAFLVDTPVCEFPTLSGCGTSGRTSGVSPVPGGLAPPPWVLSSIDALSAIFIS